MFKSFLIALAMVFDGFPVAEVSGVQILVVHVLSSLLIIRFLLFEHTLSILQAAFGLIILLTVVQLVLLDISFSQSVKMVYMPLAIISVIGFCRSRYTFDRSSLILRYFFMISLFVTFADAFHGYMTLGIDYFLNKPFYWSSGNYINGQLIVLNLLLLVARQQRLISYYVVFMVYLRVRAGVLATLIMFWPKTLVSLILLGFVILYYLYGIEYLSAISSSRIDIWIVYIESILNSPILITIGAGYGSLPATGVGAFNVDFLAHNFLLQQLYSYGIIGTSIILVGIFLQCKSERNFSTVFIPALTLTLFNNLFNSPLFWLLVFLHMRALDKCRTSTSQIAKL